MNDVLKQIPAPLLSWFYSHARILPWRDEPTPYRVWVSEIMLQQTRVESVKPYYQRFLTALPEISSLAGCEEDRLLKLWEGLGYYNRVRNMKTAAQTIMEEYDGIFPSDYKDILSLKGIGDYTAGAIASIAFQIPVPAVDGNVLRVISRLILNYDDILKASVKKRITSELLDIIPHDQPGAFNQALMELGALVCIPNGAPHCEECPLHSLCKAHLERKTAEIPYKKPSAKRKEEYKTILILRDTTHVAIRKRPPVGLLAGLYELPSIQGHLSKEQVLSHLRVQGLTPLTIQELKTSRHVFSHIEWHMKAFLIQIPDRETIPDYLFIPTKETKDTYPIPSAFEAYKPFLQMEFERD